MKKKVLTFLLIIFALVVSFLCGIANFDKYIFYSEQSEDRCLTAEDIRKLGYGNIPLPPGMDLGKKITWEKNINKKVGIYASYLVNSDNFDDDFDVEKEYAKVLYNWTKENIKGKHCEVGGKGHLSQYYMYYGEVLDFDDVYMEFSENKYLEKGIRLNYAIKVRSKYAFTCSKYSYLKITFECYKRKTEEGIDRISSLYIRQVFAK